LYPIIGKKIPLQELLFDKNTDHNILYTKSMGNSEVLPLPSFRYRTLRQILPCNKLTRHSMYKWKVSGCSQNPTDPIY